MRQKKNNVDNSSTLQALLDIEKALIQTNDSSMNNLLAKVVDARKDYEKNKAVMRTADLIFNAHRYPDKSINFVKFQSFTNNQILINLTADACKVLMILIQNISVVNCIEIKIDVFIKLLKIARRTLIRVLQELVDAGCIAKLANNNRNRGSIYILNPEIARVGNNRITDVLYSKITSQDDLDCFKDLSKPFHKVIKSTILLDDETAISYTSIDLDN